MMPLRLCCLGMTAAFREDAGEDDETLGAWSGWRKDGGALMDALMAVSAKENAIDLAVLGLRMKAAR